MFMKYTYLLLILMIVPVSITVAQETDRAIVYLTSNEDGATSIWIADLADPDNPAELINVGVRREVALHTFPDRNTILYQYRHEGNVLHNEFLDPDTGEIWRIPFFDNCIRKAGTAYESCNLQTTAGYIAFQHEIWTNDGERPRIIVTVVNLETRALSTIYDIEPDSVSDQPLPRWIPGTTQLVYLTPADGAVIYDVEQKTVIDPSQLAVDVSSGITALALEDIPINLPEPVHSDSDSQFVRMSYEVMDWLPEDNTVLVLENWSASVGEDGAGNHFDVVQINLKTIERNVIIENTRRLIHEMAYNPDASELLISFSPVLQSTQRIAIFDLLTDEEVLLPFTGYHPRWIQSNQ